MEIKEIDLAKGSFMANGKEYFIEAKISTRRWVIWRKTQAETGFGVQLGTMFENISQAYACLNQSDRKIADASVILYNILHGIKKVMDEDEIPEVITMCALFMNTKDEDRRYLSDALIREKYNDWEKEGIDMNSFFAFAINSIPGYIEAYEKLTPGISRKKKATAKSS